MKAFTEKRFLPTHELEPEAKNKVLAQIREYLLPTENIVFSYVHGSFVKYKQFRDIDIAIFVNDKKGFYFESDLSAELTYITKFDVEVRIINEAPVAFQMAVLRDGILLFSKAEDMRTSFIEDVGKRYIEYAHFRNIFLGCDGVRQR
ncbi:MAG: nucleotidyltransferase domain-containing protein [Thermodesulfovibrionia bacterium]|nr:nucleotidyltransferase domain-containing protein [Thermodesulfovibrionia bacterium]